MSLNLAKRVARYFVQHEYPTHGRLEPFILLKILRVIGKIDARLGHDPEPDFFDASTGANHADSGILDARVSASCLIHRDAEQFCSTTIEDIVGAAFDAQDSIVGQAADVSRIPP